jgi:hypothetical protein
MADEEPSTPTDGWHSDGVFDEIVVDPVMTRLQVTGERVVFVGKR